LEKFFRELVGFTAGEYGELRASEDFGRIKALAHTVPREMRALRRHGRSTLTPTPRSTLPPSY
jgi:hypothetical protein